MRKLQEIEKIGITFSVIAMITFGVAFIVGTNNHYERLHDEYKTVQKGDCFNGQITDLYITHGACFMTLSTSEKILPIDKYNKSYKNDWEVRFSWNVEVGDTLIKEIDSDSIKLIKNGKEYNYKLEFINEN